MRLDGRRNVGNVEHSVVQTAWRVLDDDVHHVPELALAVEQRKEVEYFHHLFERSLAVFVLCRLEYFLALRSSHFVFERQVQNRPVAVFHLADDHGLVCVSDEFSGVVLQDALDLEVGDKSLRVPKSNQVVSGTRRVHERPFWVCIESVNVGVVVVENGDAGSDSGVPDSDLSVPRAWRQKPGNLVVPHESSDKVSVSFEHNAFFSFYVPDADRMVVWPWCKYVFGERMPDDIEYSITVTFEYIHNIISAYITTIVMVSQTEQVNYQTLRPESFKKAHNRSVELTRLRKRGLLFESLFFQTVLSRVN